jgi:Sulfotransferase family
MTARMTARRLVIDAKTRPYPLAVVGPHHFAYHDGEPVDPRTVVGQPGTSLYCLDPERRLALFVEADPGADLLAAPFYFQAQYDAARALVAVPYDDLHALAAEVPFDPARLVLVYSVGRCGSTLVSRVFRAAPGVASLAEPDVLTQLITLRTGGYDEAELARLVDTCTRLVCAGAGPAYSAWAVKFRSFGVALHDLYERCFPEARVVVLYRDAVPWARSAARAFSFSRPSTPDEMRALQERIGRLDPPLADYARRAGLLTRMQFMAGQWVSFMVRARSLHGFAVRYEELTAVPEQVFAAMFDHCGLSRVDGTTLRQVLAEDSQEGSDISRSAVRDTVGDAAEHRVSDADVAELERTIAALAPDIAPDQVLPGSFGAPVR